LFTADRFCINPFLQGLTDVFRAQRSSVSESCAGIGALLEFDTSIFEPVLTGFRQWIREWTEKCGQLSYNFSLMIVRTGSRNLYQGDPEVLRVLELERTSYERAVLIEAWWKVEKTGTWASKSVSDPLTYVRIAVLNEARRIKRDRDYDEKLLPELSCKEGQQVVLIDELLNDSRLVHEADDLVKPIEIKMDLTKCALTVEDEKLLDLLEAGHDGHEIAEILG